MAKRICWGWLVVVLLTGMLAACGGGGGDGGSDDGTYGVGDSATVGDVVITLDEASLVVYRVGATFTVVNNGSTDLVLDPETSFAIVGDSTGTEVPLTLDPVSCDNSLTGTVPAGGTLTGDLCWRSNPSDTWPLLAQITYAGGETESGPAVWTVEAEE